MTKEIIIDGVDVSGCEELRIDPNVKKKYINETSMLCRETCYLMCAQTSNCYYKQLKRKEQECNKLKEQSKNKCAFRCLGNEFCPDAEKEIEELKTVYNDILSSCKNEQIECEKLKAENEELKKEIETHKNNAESYYNSYKQSCECNGILNDKIAKLQDEYETAQTLATRARNIGKKYLKALDEIETSIINVCKEECGYDKILDIIAKAKGKE